MRNHFPRLIAWVAAAWVAASSLHAQSLPQLENDVRNIFSLQSPGAWPPPAPGLDVDPRTPTPNQWRSGTVFGGWQTTRILGPGGEVLAGAISNVPGTTSLIYPAFKPLDIDGNPLPEASVILQSSAMARPLIGSEPTVFFGDIIPRPAVDHGGDAVDPTLTYLPEPDNSTSEQFYYSPHARAVFATQSGPIVVTWRFRDPAHVPQTLTVKYVVSGAPAPGRESKRIFWTEKGFNGPVVAVPSGPIAAVNVRNNTQFPRTVPTEFASPYIVAGDPNVTLPPEKRTFWYSTTDRAFHAYNLEGRAFVEFLGAEDRTTGLRQFLGTEVVEVIREVNPAKVNVSVGDRILPHDNDTTLSGRVVNGVAGATPFVHMQGVPSKNEVHYYAVRTTTPTVPAGEATGEMVFYWMRKGALDLLWPRYYNTYVCTWPTDIDAYTTYVRPDAADGDASATGITLEQGNNTALVFQDDPNGQHAQVLNGNTFYTTVSITDPEGRTLLRHTNGEHVWFERIYSKLDTTFSGYQEPVVADVGVRIEPPAGHEALVGYIRQPSGTDFDIGAYIDPFIAGFEAARRGAIIPVNARPGANLLEVWWYKKNAPPAGTGIAGALWPVSVQRYQLQWPASPDRIVLASNAGSGELPSNQAAGTIYTQNDDTLPGFNPNDEHALMLAGRVYALRDDLGSPATSLPYVLLRYVAFDGRPAMRVFQVLREDLENGIAFNYSVNAGRVLQAPMPIPLLPTVYHAGLVKVPANSEVQPAQLDMPENGTDAPVHYNRFTFTDRKGTSWVYRGPHAGEGEGIFQMKYYYPAQKGFFIPGATEQPKGGEAMPYLRAANGAGGFVGAATGIAGQPLSIAFRPQWPVDAPVLNLGETLTTSVNGLPAVRGQTSVEMLYDQSLAAEAGGSSATLTDPTVAKVSLLADYDLDKLPSSVFTNEYQGKTFFPNLPPHLVERFYFDPNLGDKGGLVLIGQFKDEALGADYLLLNVLSAKDTAALHALCNASDTDLQHWKDAVDGLSVTTRALEEDPKKLGTFKPVDPPSQARTDKVWTYISGLAWETRTKIPTETEIKSGASLGAGEDVSNAHQWMADHFSDLIDWKKSSTENSAAAELQTLKSKFESHQKPTQPGLSRTYYATNPGFTQSHYTRVKAALAELWQDYDRKLAVYTALRDWIFDPVRNWNSTGRDLRVNHLLAVEFPDASETTADKNKAWSFVEAHRSELEKWDAGRLNATEFEDIRDALKDDFEQSEADSELSVGPTEAVKITGSNVPVDSYALSAVDGGEGWLVLMSGNGRPLTPAEEPVSLHVIRVAAPLGRGEMKVIQPSNPLSEKLTLQHALDFAGEPDNYEFQWRTLPPVDGQPPVLYTFTSALVVGDGVWTATTMGGSNAAVGLPGQVLARNNNTEAAAVAARKAADSAAATAAAAPNDQAKATAAANAAAAAANAEGLVAQTIGSLTRTFSLNTLPFRAFVSVSLGSLDGATIAVNGVTVARRNVPGEANSATTRPPLPSFTPLPVAFEVPVSMLRTGTEDNVLTITPYTTGDIGSSSSINVRFEVMNETDNSSSWILVGPEPGESNGALAGAVQGRNRYVIEGNSIFTLTDNYFTARYRARDTGHAAYDAEGGWSKWTDPQLAEGWIKRALAGINPFEQRVKDLYNNDINTDVSLVMQAGKRWEGDIALNLQNINNFGLIEIYETILRRGKGLSIEGAPPINYGPANDALLLAAGYLSDLYMLLGNEAYADAANPTIAFSTDGGQFGDVATSLFAFKGQLATVLDEELALLRGRDDFLTPGTRVTPVFNRLIWNYTRGIDSGEAIYALNYNIKDLNADGVVGAADAAKAFPQGHGDAYGHYLTALTGYYGLLWNENFDWVPRSEAVLVLGKPVSVDYLDERKFATAAAAWTRTAAQITELSYRAAYNPAAESAPTWTHLADGRTNSRTGQQRSWGVDDWAVRGGQGAFFHWLTSNSTLPDVDPDPNHEGIQKIDRTTVPELAEIVAQNDAIQRALDTADARLNPLGLSGGAVPFDISPAEVDAGKTHFEQVYSRATDTLKNAVLAFNNAKGSTQFLRSQEETLAKARDSIGAQERAFTAQLVDLYGTPYAGDIGPGKTYVQGYVGPDLVNFMYVETPELFHDFEEDGMDGVPFRLSLDQEFKDNDPTKPVFNKETADVFLSPAGTFLKPDSFTGQRAHPGRIQTAISELLSARINLGYALEDCEGFETEMNRLLRVYEAARSAHNRSISEQEHDFRVITGLKASIALLETGVGAIELTEKSADDVVDAINEAFPKSVGLATDATAPARGVLKAAAAVGGFIKDYGGFILDTAARALGLSIESIEALAAIEAEEIAWTAENAQLIYDLKTAFQDMEGMSRAVDTSLRAYEQAERNLRTLTAQGRRIMDERQVFRQKSAALIQGYRTKDLGFRAFRNEALESYKSLFDLASRYTYLAAKAYDYETGLVDAGGNITANTFLRKVVSARALGIFSNGVPQPAGSTGGDPGLSGALARMNSDWAVAKSRFGFNNPDRYRTTFSLRRERERIISGPNGDAAWKDFLASKKRDNLLDDPDVRRFCMNVNSAGALAVPGFVIEFDSTIATGYNFFGKPLAGGDSSFSPTSFATKIRSTGVAFPGYVGMSAPTSLNGSLSGTGSTSPNDPVTSFNDPNALSATPYIYVVPAGEDSMRAPGSTDSNIVRTWRVEDQAIPLPFDIGGAFSNSTVITSGASLSEPFTIRKHQAFRAVPDGNVFSSGNGFTNSRLIGRSVWNSRWKIVIPGSTLLSNPVNGMKTFEETVKDILIHFETYSYSGN